MKRPTAHTMTVMIGQMIAATIILLGIASFWSSKGLPAMVIAPPVENGEQDVARPPKNTQV